MAASTGIREMSQTFRANSVSQAAVSLFAAAGAAGYQALATVESLVTSSLMGHDSHGVIRTTYIRSLGSAISINRYSNRIRQSTCPASAVLPPV